MTLARSLVRMGIAIAGLAIVAFFTLLLGIADCGPDCVARGERAPVFALIGLGAFLLTLGIALRGGARRAVGLALLVGGAVALAGTLWTVADGARGWMAWATLAAGAGCAAIGAYLLRPARR